MRHIPTNRQYRISKLIDYTYILAADENGQGKVLKIDELGLPETNIIPCAGDLDQLEDKLWAKAKYRHKLIQPLLKDEIIGRTTIEAYTKGKGVGYSSLYRWPRVYKTSDSISSLNFPTKRLVERYIQTGSRNREHHSGIDSEILLIRTTSLPDQSHPANTGFMPSAGHQTAGRQFNQEADE